MIEEILVTIGALIFIVVIVLFGIGAVLGAHADNRMCVMLDAKHEKRRRRAESAYLMRRWYELRPKDKQDF